jgi:invasion protein IalB
MPFLTTRFWATILVGSLFLPGVAFAQATTPTTRKPTTPPAHAPAAPAPAPAAPAAPAAPTPQPDAAGGQPQGGTAKADLVPVQPTWTKLCNKDQAGRDICLTTRDFGVQADQPILSLAINDIKGADTRAVRLALPPAFMLRPGIRLSIDKGVPIEGNFEICFPNACFAEAPVKNPVVDSIKKATTLTVSVKNQVGNQVDFNVPLAGFGDAFDGPAMDPKVLEEQQKKLQEELQKRAEEERKRLEAAQPAAGGAAPPAAPAPAPAAAPK